MQSLRMQFGDGITDLCHGSLVPLDVRRVACCAGEWHETSFDGRFEALFSSFDCPRDIYGICTSMYRFPRKYSMETSHNLKQFHK